MFSGSNPGFGGQSGFGTNPGGTTGTGGFGSSVFGGSASTVSTVFGSATTTVTNTIVGGNMSTTSGFGSGPFGSGPSTGFPPANVSGFSTSGGGSTGFGVTSPFGTAAADTRSPSSGMFGTTSLNKNEGSEPKFGASLFGGSTQAGSGSSGTPGSFGIQSESTFKNTSGGFGSGFGTSKIDTGFGGATGGALSSNTEFSSVAKTGFGGATGSGFSGTSDGGFRGSIQLGTPINTNQTQKLDQGSSLFTGSNTTRQSGGLFGISQTGQNVETTQSENVFSQTSKAGASTLFSGSTETTSSSSLFSNSGTDTTASTTVKTLFGKPVTQSGASDTIAAPTYKTLFGKPMTQSGGTDTTSTTAFKPLFGKPGTLSGGSDDSSRTTTLFGKPQPETEVSLFGKPPQEDQGGAVSLFGKPVKEDKTSDKLRGWSTRDADSDRDSSGRRMLRRPVTGDLFNTAVTDMNEGKKLARKRSLGEDTSEAAEDESSERKSVLRRRTSVVADDLSSKVAIVCKGVPSKFNNVFEMRKHFNQFGRVHRVYPNPRKQQATVHFVDHESAKIAKARGRFLARGIEPMQINWSSYTGPSSGRPSQSHGANTNDKSPGSREVRRTIVNEVNDELRSMAGTSDVSFGEAKPLHKSKVKELSGISRSHSPALRNRSPSPKPRTQSPAPTRSADVQGMIKSLSASVSHTSQEKYEIMLTSDKVVREALGLHMKKQTDLADAKTLTASCPDMCPEKERYQREYQRRLGAYEMIPGTDQVDHSRAVKEYSRSSADQDLPLPTELRPPEVLDKTMNYLLNNIADDGGDGKWGDWFDFLWNRTRSIRKEITQLQLCDPTSVSLVEKCTRLHIFCSERLCEEDMMVFDEKINNENLTKCLQTLKEMYHDLETKKGVLCTNEAEFRSYIVLMNLNEGDVLREVQQLRPEVRDSAELRFVQNVHSALNSNNYIRFFKLVSQAEFLPACIMHRYFNQVRAKALHIMSKAYKSNPVSVPEIKRLLLFESEREVVNFCNHHGLSVQEDQVSLDRNAIIIPEQSFPPSRAINIIETKQHTSVGEAINGSPIPRDNLGQPSNSFDSSGHFIVSSLPIPSSLLQGQTQTSQSITRPAPERKPVLLEEAPESGVLTYTNEVVKDLAKELFLDIIKEFSTNMATTFVKAINVYLQKAGPLVDDLIDEVVSEESKTVTTDAIEEYKKEQAEQLARQKAELSLAREKASKQITEDLVDLVINEEIMKITKEEYSLVQEELKEESVQRVSNEISLNMLNEIVVEECEDLSEDTYQTDVVEKLQQLEETGTAVQLLVKARFYNRWKNRLADRQRLQKSMATFPPAPSMNMMEHQLSAMLPDSQGIREDSLHIGNSAHITLLPPGTILQNYTCIQKSLVLQQYWSRIRHEKAWAPLDVANIVGQQLVKIIKSQNRRVKPWLRKVERLYWKLLICLPESRSSQDTEVLCNWVQAKFKRGSVPKSTLPNITKLLSLYHRDIFPHYEIGLCIRAVTGVPNHQERNILHSQGCLEAISAVLFVLKQLPNFKRDYDEYWTMECSRLRLIIEKNIDLNIQPPLMVLVPFNDFTENEIKRFLETVTFIDDELISDCDIMILNNGLDHTSTSRQLIQAVQSLASRWQETVLPCKQYLQDFVEETVYQEFYGVVYQDLAKRGKNGGLHQGPEQLLAMYNSLVDHMSEVVSDQNLSHVPWPIPEFVDTCKSKDMPNIGWNSPEYLSSLRETILELSLPDWECDTEGEDWTQAVDDVWAYIHVVVEEGGNNAALYSKINNLLSKARDSFEEHCFFSLGEDNCDPLYVNMPWTDIIMACVGYRLNTLQPHLDSNEMEVYYFNSKLKEFRPPEEWFNAVRNDKQKDLPVVQDSFIRSVKRKHDDSTSVHNSPKYRPPNSPGIKLELENPNHVMSKELSHDLDKAIATERKANEDFEAYLQKTIAAGESVEVNESIDFSFTPLELEVPLFRRLSAPAAAFFSPGLNRSKSSKLEKKSGPLFYSPGLSKSIERPKSAEGMYESLDKDLTVTDKLDLLSNSLNSQKQANKLFEMRLQSFIERDRF